MTRSWLKFSNGLSRNQKGKNGPEKRPATKKNSEMLHLRTVELMNKMSVKIVFATPRVLWLGPKTCWSSFYITSVLV